MLKKKERTRMQTALFVVKVGLMAISFCMMMKVTSFMWGCWRASKKRRSARIKNSERYSHILRVGFLGLRYMWKIGRKKCNQVDVMVLC